MRPRFLIYLSILVLALFVLMLWLRPKHEALKTTASLETVQITNQSLLSKTNAVSKNSIYASTTPSTRPQKLIDSADKRNPANFEKYIESKNSPIEFYGKVIDQDSNALAGAKIKIGIRQWYVPVPGILNEEGRFIDLEQTSDANGRFEFHGVTGDGFGVGIIKDGYLSPPNARYGFGPQAGTFENPIIFKMWRIGEKAQLVSGGKFWGITPDKKNYTIDFLEQSKVESDDAPGDIRISIKRPEQIKPHTHFDWSFSIEAINGGLIKTDDEFLYLAPESGYQSSYQITMSATNTNWKRELDGLQFYLKSRGGQVYGRFTFDIIPDYNKVSVFNVSWAVNPNGSRNLQP